MIIGCVTLVMVLNSNNYKWSSPSKLYRLSSSSLYVRTVKFAPIQPCQDQSFSTVFGRAAAILLLILKHLNDSSESLICDQRRRVTILYCSITVFYTGCCFLQGNTWCIHMQYMSITSLTVDHHTTAQQEMILTNTYPSS